MPRREAATTGVFVSILLGLTVNACSCLTVLLYLHSVLLQLLCFFLILIVAVYVQYKQICESGIGSEIEWHRTFLIYMDLVECQYQRSPPPISAALFYDDFCCYRITVSPNLLKV